MYIRYRFTGCVRKWDRQRDADFSQDSAILANLRHFNYHSRMIINDHRICISLLDFLARLILNYNNSDFICELSGSYWDFIFLTSHQTDSGHRFRSWQQDEQNQEMKTGYQSTMWSGRQQQPQSWTAWRQN